MSPVAQEMYRKAIKKTLAKTPSVQKEGWNIINGLNTVINKTRSYAKKASDTLSNAEGAAKTVYQTYKDYKDVAMPIISFIGALLANANGGNAIPHGFNAADNYVI